MSDFAVVLWCWKPRARSRPKGRIEFSPALANKQAKAIQVHLNMPHEIVCVTDFPAHEFDSHIRVIDADQHFDDWAHLGGCYRRLKAFDPSMKELIAPRFVWMDLDMIVIKDLAPLFQHDHTIKCWKSESMPRQPINGSMVQMVAGAHARVWKEFDVAKTPAAARLEGYRGTDQAIMAYMLGNNIPLWTWRDGVMHLGRHCGHSLLPEIARVVFTPGGAKMTDPSVQRRYPWISQYFTDNPTASPDWFGPKPPESPFRPWRRMQQARQAVRDQNIRGKRGNRP